MGSYITVNNPNEIAKVKHLLALAECLSNKIDGDGSSIGTPLVIDNRPTPTLELSTNNLYSIRSDLSNRGNTNGSVINYTGDGTLYAYIKSGGGGVIQVGVNPTTNNLVLRTEDATVKEAGVVVLAATGTDNYKPVEVEYEFPA